MGIKKQQTSKRAVRTRNYALPTADYIKVGRLNATVARAAKIETADIYISYNNLKHITNKHGIEIRNVGFAVLTYLELIVKNYNQIRKGSGSSILLVVYSTPNEAQKTAIIDLNYSIEKHFWEIKTAQPRSTKDLAKRKIIWKK